MQRGCGGPPRGGGAGSENNGGGRGAANGNGHGRPRGAPERARSPRRPEPRRLPRSARAAADAQAAWRGGRAILGALSGPSNGAHARGCGDVLMRGPCLRRRVARFGGPKLPPL